jgi:hypothetical protein
MWKRGINGRIILKRVLEEVGWFRLTGEWPVAGSRGRSTKPSGPIKYRIFVTS